MNTNEQCSPEGIHFIPMIIEASGGAWGLNAEEVWKSIIKSTAVLSGEPISSVANELYQSLSVTLQKSNARAILKRLP